MVQTLRRDFGLNRSHAQAENFLALRLLCALDRVHEGHLAVARSLREEIGLQPGDALRGQPNGNPDEFCAFHNVCNSFVGHPQRPLRLELAKHIFCEFLRGERALGAGIYPPAVFRQPRSGRERRDVAPVARRTRRH